MVTLVEKKGTLKTLQSAIQRAISDNGNLDFTNFIDIAYELDNEINRFENTYKIKAPVKAIPVSKDNKPSNGHPGIYLLAH
ncbi:MAG: hypothetical protein LW711_17625 [Saprospiraceae bacterium]|jgi:hypothetical protein|nr:hypothetical protein [Saprospiraceae bacterium]